MLANKSSINLRFAYDGPVLKNHEMDARDLALAILTITSLIDEASKELKSDFQPIIKINTSLKPGSVEIYFHLAQETAKQTLDLFNTPTATGLLNILGALGFASPGLFSLLKWLKGQLPDKVVKQEDGRVKFFLKQNALLCSRGTDTLFKSKNIRREYSRILTPLEKDGVEKFEIRSGKNVFDSASKEDIKSFENPFELVEDELINSYEIRKIFSIASLDFRPGNKWRLYDGTTPILVEIKDESFLRKVSENESFFLKDDILIVQLKVDEYRTSKGIKAERCITKVHQHIHAEKQLKLQYDNSSE